MKIGQIIYVYVSPDVDEGEPGWFQQKWYRGIVIGYSKNKVTIEFADGAITRLDVKKDEDLLYVPSDTIKNKDVIDDIVVVMLNQDSRRWYSGIIADINGDQVNVLFDDGGHAVIPKGYFTQTAQHLERAIIVSSVAEAEEWTVHRNTVAELPMYSSKKALIEPMDTLKVSRKKPDTALANLEEFFNNSVLDQQKGKRVKQHDLTFSKIYDDETLKVEPLPTAKDIAAKKKLMRRAATDDSSSNKVNGNRKKPKRGE